MPDAKDWASAPSLVYQQKTHYIYAGFLCTHIVRCVARFAARVLPWYIWTVLWPACWPATEMSPQKRLMGHNSCPNTKLAHKNACNTRATSRRAWFSCHVQYHARFDTLSLAMMMLMEGERACALCRLFTAHTLCLVYPVGHKSSSPKKRARSPRKLVNQITNKTPHTRGSRQTRALISQ